jgi:hypothetical protein
VTDFDPSAEYLFDPDHSIELGPAYLGILSNTEFRTVNDPDSRAISPHRTRSIAQDCLPDRDNLRWKG